MTYLIGFFFSLAESVRSKRLRRGFEINSAYTVHLNLTEWGWKSCKCLCARFVLFFLNKLKCHISHYIHGEWVIITQRNLRLSHVIIFQEDAYKTKRFKAEMQQSIYIRVWNDTAFLRKHGSHTVPFFKSKLSTRSTQSWTTYSSFYYA